MYAASPRIALKLLLESISSNIIDVREGGTDGSCSMFHLPNEYTYKQRQVPTLRKHAETKHLEKKAEEKRSIRCFIIRVRFGTASGS